MGEAVRPETESGRGREATTPSAIPRSGWRDILWRTKSELSRDNASLIAAGVAFYGLLAAFPAVAGVISVYGLVADPASATQFFANAPALPQEARTILSEQARRVAETPSSALGLGLAGAVLLAIYGASKAVSALIMALNVAYEEDEERGFVRLTLLSLGLTAAVMLFVVFALLLIVGVPAVVAALSLP
ncbi:MAG: YihY/virulence factor BrkB family protein, partial [Thermodesulfobacteriota bacterium]